MWPTGVATGPQADDQLQSIQVTDAPLLTERGVSLPMALSQTALARAIGVPPRRINEIVLGQRSITADTDLRFARYFGLSEGFFLSLQSDFDLMQRRRMIGPTLEAIRPREHAA